MLHAGEEAPCSMCQRLYYVVVVFSIRKVKHIFAVDPLNEQSRVAATVGASSIKNFGQCPNSLVAGTRTGFRFACCAWLAHPESRDGPHHMYHPHMGRVAALIHRSARHRCSIVVLALHHLQMCRNGGQRSTLTMRSKDPDVCLDPVDCRWQMEPRRELRWFLSRLSEGAHCLPEGHQNEHPSFCWFPLWASLGHDSLPDHCHCQTVRFQ